MDVLKYILGMYYTRGERDYAWNNFSRYTNNLPQQIVLSWAPVTAFFLPEVIGKLGLKPISNMHEFFSIYTRSAIALYLLVAFSWSFYTRRSTNDKPYSNSCPMTESWTIFYSTSNVFAHIPTYVVALYIAPKFFENVLMHLFSSMSEKISHSMAAALCVTAFIRSSDDVTYDTHDRSAMFFGWALTFVSYFATSYFNINNTNAALLIRSAPIFGVLLMLTGINNNNTDYAPYLLCYTVLYSYHEYITSKAFNFILEKVIENGLIGEITAPALFIAEMFISGLLVFQLTQPLSYVSVYSWKP